MLLHKKTVLVTGGAGFIGSHLVEELVRSSCYNVISVDNYYTGRIENHIVGARCVFGHTRHLNRVIKERADIVFHLGEYARVESSFVDVKDVWDANVADTFGVLDRTSFSVEA